MSEEPTIRYWLSEGQPTWMTRLRTLGWLWPLGLAAIAAARSAPPKGYLLPAFCLAMWVAGLVLTRKAVVEVTHEDISVPFKGRIPWSTVSHVNRPGQVDEHVSVTLQDGTVRDVFLPAGMAQEVARIGGAPLGDPGPPGSGR